MRSYETMVIVHPEVTGEALTAVVDKFKGVLEDQGSKILKVDDWGLRTLAYPIKKQAKGTYVLLIFEATPEAVKEMERRMRIEDSIMRFQTVLFQGAVAEAAEAKKEEAPAEAEAEAPAEVKAEPAE